MAHPKRKISKTRRDKRRTHYKAAAATVVLCPQTGEAHLPHKAYVSGTDLWLNGKVVIENYTGVAAEA